MAEKLVIEIFKDKPVAELAKIISEPDSKLETGSAAAVFVGKLVGSGDQSRLREYVRTVLDFLHGKEE